jgi:hypothetical protein
LKWWVVAFRDFTVIVEPSTKLIRSSGHSVESFRQQHRSA